MSTQELINVLSISQNGIGAAPTNVANVSGQKVIFNWYNQVVEITHNCVKVDGVKQEPETSQGICSRLATLFLSNGKWVPKIPCNNANECCQPVCTFAGHPDQETITKLLMEIYSTFHDNENARQILSQACKNFEVKFRYDCKFGCECHTKICFNTHPPKQQLVQEQKQAATTTTTTADNAIVAPKIDLSVVATITANLRPDQQIVFRNDGTFVIESKNTTDQVKATTATTTTTATKSKPTTVLKKTLAKSERSSQKKKPICTNGGRACNLYRNTDEEGAEEHNATFLHESGKECRDGSKCPHKKTCIHKHTNQEKMSDVKPSAEKPVDDIQTVCYGKISGGKEKCTDIKCSYCTQPSPDLKSTDFPSMFAPKSVIQPPKSSWNKLPTDN